ncbi:MAG: DUF1801 domain-containing protein [Myxococcota bacterium]
MHSDATTVDAYLASLPDDRRHALSTLRELVQANLPDGYVEGFGHGMIAYTIPLATYPDTYNGEPLLYAAMASQKNHLALYLQSVYADPAVLEAFTTAWKASGKKLDMGKSCVRFRRLDDVAVDAVAQAIRAIPAAAFVAHAKAVRGRTKR